MTALSNRPLYRELASLIQARKECTRRTESEQETNVGATLEWFDKTAAGRTVTLAELYDNGELDDENEGIGSYVAQFGRMELDAIANRPYTVRTLPDEKVKQLKASDSQTVLEVFKDHAEPWQKQLVKRKAKNFDRNRIIVLDGGYVVDGNHQAVAAAQLNQPVQYIDLEEPESKLAAGIT